jgi:type IV pilus assembly protein PilM
MAFGLSSLASFLGIDTTKASIKAGVLGIDFGSSAIKFVQLREVKGVPTLETYGELQLGPYEGVDVGRSTHVPPQKMIEALTNILEEAGATAEDATFALAYSASFVVTIPVPTLDPEKIGPMIPIEAKKYIPTLLTQVNLEWFPLSIHEETMSTIVLISAVYNDVRMQCESVVKGCNLNSIASEIEVFSSIRAVLSPKDDNVVILDCGASSTRMYIVKKGVIGRTHSVFLGGVELTKVLAETLSVEFSVAESLKRDVGISAKSDDSRIQKKLITTLEPNIRELHMVMKQFEKDEGVTIDKVVLNGGGAQLKGLATYVQDMFSCPVVIAEPFSKVAYPAFLEDTLKEAGPSFAVALGSALQMFQKTE